MTTTAYTFGYGEVTFSEEDGTPVFSTTADLGLWTTVDEEPSPEPKWVRVSVPGADGSVDLSRALTGQVQYESREITLQFAGKRDTHAEALALVHRMRRALHGARVRVETMLTAQIGGWYVADCECDGTAEADGGVVIDVRATADPFIRVGNVRLALAGDPGSLRFNGTVIPCDELTEAMPPSETTYELSLPSYVRQPSQAPTGSVYTPPGVTTGDLWWATGANLLDASMWPVAQSTSALGVQRSGQRLVLGTIGGTGRLQLVPTSTRGTWPMWPYGFPFGAVSGVQEWVETRVGHLWLTLFAAGAVMVGGGDVTLKAIFDGSAADATTGLVTGEATATATWAASGGFYNEAAVASIDLTTFCAGNQDAQVLSAIEVEVGAVVAPLYVAFSLTIGDSAPTTWEEARLGSAAIDFGGTYCGAYVVGSGGGWSTDMFVIDPVGCHNESYCMPTLNPEVGALRPGMVEVPGTVTAMPPADATCVCATLDATGGTVPYVELLTQTFSSITVTGTNDTMRATPSVHTDDGGEVTIDGRTMRVPGGTQELSALVIPGGEFEVEFRPYRTYNYLDPDAQYLTWEGGAL